MYAALPRSDYYGSSAPTTPRQAQAAPAASAAGAVGSLVHQSIRRWRWMPVYHPSDLFGRSSWRSSVEGTTASDSWPPEKRSNQYREVQTRKRTSHHAGLVSTRKSPYLLTLGGSLTDFCSSSVPSKCQAPRLVLCASTQGYRSARASHGRLLRSCRMPGWAYPRPTADSGFTALLIGASKRTFPVGIERPLLFALTAKVLQVGLGGIMQSLTHGVFSFREVQVVVKHSVTHINIQAFKPLEVKAFLAYSWRKTRFLAGRAVSDIRGVIRGSGRGGTAAVSAPTRLDVLAESGEADQGPALLSRLS